MRGIFFVSSSVLLSMIVQQLFVILVFSQDRVRARPSTLPSCFRAPIDVILVIVSYCPWYIQEIKWALSLEIDL